MTRFIQTAAIAAIASLASQTVSARGEVFVLESGGRIVGELLNANRTAGSNYLVLTEEGVRLALNEQLVRRVVVKSDVQKQYEALLPTVPNSAAGHWKLAEWCLEAGLLDERRKHLQAVIGFEPDHEEARKALGYSKYGSRWLTQEEYMESQGYVRYRGAWRTKQDAELDAKSREQDLEVKQWRVNIRRWFEQLGGRHGATAERELAQVRDPLAAPALAEIVGDAKLPRGMRLQALDMLGKLPPGLATATLVKVAMDDRDENVRDRCLDELKRQGAHTVVPLLLHELKSKDNRRVNRAALCLQRLGDASATLPLIEALVTEHTFIVNPGGGGGGGTPLSFSAGGPTSAPGGGGLGGLSVGGKPKKIKRDLQNSLVLGALTHLHPGVNFQYDVDSWKAWYIQTHTSVNTDLRRDP